MIKIMAAIPILLSGMHRNRWRGAAISQPQMTTPRVEICSIDLRPMQGSDIPGFFSCAGAGTCQEVLAAIAKPYQPARFWPELATR